MSWLNRGKAALTTRRYESPLMVRMGKEDCLAYIATHHCHACGFPIDATVHDFVVHNDSDRGVWAGHRQCPQAKPEGTGG